MPKSLKEEFTLCGLEASQHLLLDAVKKVGFKDYNSKINLVHQLLRRHALIVNNNLSDKEVDEKSLILNEEFSQDAKKALEILGGEIEKIENFVIPDTDIERNIIIVKKVKETPKQYPRKAGTPAKQPIK